MLDSTRYNTECTDKDKGDNSCSTLDVHVFQTHHPFMGETFINPAVLELRFYNRFFGLRINLKRRDFSTLKTVGNLPFGVDGEHNILSTAHTIEAAMQMRQDLKHITRLESLEEESLSYLELIQHDLGQVLSDMLWRDSTIYNEYTRPIILSSMPFFTAYFSCWLYEATPRFIAEAFVYLRPNNTYLSKGTVAYYAPYFVDITAEDLCRSQSVTAMRLQKCLHALRSYLGDELYFGGDRPNAVDARAFSFLAVLFSIPQRFVHTAYKQVITTYPQLVDYCKRVNHITHVWENEDSFLTSFNADADINGEANGDEKEAVGRYIKRLWLFGTVIASALYFMSR